MPDNLNTTHNIIFTDSSDCSQLSDESVDLIVTSPPYPMVEMWDYLNTTTENTFDSLHSMLDNVWRECDRVLKSGCFVCINIGDATRSVDNTFQLFNNHSRISQFFHSINYRELPNIIWRKPSNSPTKFMGSGMLPSGAYVTQEHEYILIFTKPGTREFNKQLRQESAYFWTERNSWFSDLWTDIHGTKQTIQYSNSRQRNASYPIEIPHRLINMFSCYGDIVYDPFGGLCTTTKAAIVNKRNSICCEIDETLKDNIIDNISSINMYSYNESTKKRIDDYTAYFKNSNKELKYYNENICCSVMTKQETNLKLYLLSSVDKPYITQDNIVNVTAQYALYNEENLNKLTQNKLF